MSETVEHKALNVLLSAMREPEWKELEATWRFAIGNPEEGLNTTLDRLPTEREIVTLPHRTLDPDTPYWYTASAHFEEPLALWIQADDGAQLYVNGQRIPAAGDKFLLRGVVGDVELIVRVLNKAMYGGLEHVRFVPHPIFLRHSAEKERARRLTMLALKSREGGETSEEDFDALHRVLDTPHEEGIEAVERRFASVPLLLVPPYLQDVGTDRAKIVWETNEPCAGAIFWGECVRPGGNAWEEIRTHRIEVPLGTETLGEVSLADLKPDTSYAMRLEYGNRQTDVTLFRTLPETGGFQFSVWADSQNAWNELATIVAQMGRLTLAFTVGLGDTVEEGWKNEPWQKLLQTLSPLISHTPLFLLAGNHDYDGCFDTMQSPYFERYSRSGENPHYFAWTAGNARLVALDPNIHYPTGIPIGSEQRDWFLAEIESQEWREAHWRFVFIHQPPFSQGWPEYQGDLPIRELLEPLIEPHGIDFVISGHTHDYERLTRTYGQQSAHFFIVGGAGRTTEEGAVSDEPVMDVLIRRPHFLHVRVEETTVRFRAIDPDGEEFDRLVVTKPHSA